jgi:hypothetical protein
MFYALSVVELIRRRSLMMKRAYLPKSLAISLGVTLLGLSFSGCAPLPTPSPKTDEATPNKKKSMVVDEKAKEIRLFAIVNGKYLHQPTRHGVVFAEGKNGNKSVFKAYTNQNDFHDALIKAGAKPGNNLTMKTATGKYVEGDVLDVFIIWDGADKEYRLDEVIQDSGGNGFQINFGGNATEARQKFTGCILCLDSCPVGITSNARYPHGAFASREVKFKGDKDILPPDGTSVTIVFRLP